MTSDKSILGMIFISTTKWS